MIIKFIRYFLSFCFFLIIFSCADDKELPIYGFPTEVNGVEIPHVVGTINHFNQDSLLVTNNDLKDYIQIADFFFISCPSICPRVTKEMKRIYDEFKDDPEIKLISYTIDPVRDTPNKLKIYADHLDIDHDKWLFLSGDKDSTFALANSYFVAALEDPDTPGGFDHSGKIVVVDKEGHVRAFSEGTDPKTTPQLIADVKKLKASYGTK